MSLAIFDLDNTLLAGDSDHAWGEFLVEKGLVDAAAYKEANDRFYQEYQEGCLDIFEFLQFSLEPLSQHSMQALAIWHAEFMTSKIHPMRLPKAEALLNRHREQGDFLLIITATNRFVTGPIAKLLNVDDIIATDPEIENGRYTGRIEGTPCFQQGKVVRLNAWLHEQQIDLEGSYFYSDSHNDLPLLEQVEHPIAVDADKQLLSHAQSKGWKSISLRD